jgi:ribosomal protein S18 acetylase RimI-like enzyme
MEPTSTSLVIRNARSDDAPALGKLLEELGFPTSADEIAGRLDVMSRLAELVLVAERRGELVGLLSVHVTPMLHRPKPVGRLTALVVTESARHQGVGRSLVTAAEERLLASGCGLVEVTSNRRLTEAHAFYERLGYEVTSIRLKKSLDPVV